MHIANLAPAGLVHLLNVAQDPFEIIQRLLVGRGNDRLVAGSVFLGFAIDPQNHRLAGRTHQCRVEVGHAPGGLTLDGHDVVARPDRDPNFSQRTAVLRVPILSSKNALDAEISTGIGPDDRPE